MGDTQAAAAEGRYAKLVLAYNDIFKRLVDAAKNPGAKLEDWAPLAEFVAVDEFVRVGPTDHPRLTVGGGPRDAREWRNHPPLTHQVRLCVESEHPTLGTPRGSPRCVP